MARPWFSCGGKGERGEPQLGTAFCVEREVEPSGSKDQGILQEHGDADRIIGDGMAQRGSNLMPARSMDAVKLKKGFAPFVD